METAGPVCQTFLSCHPVTRIGAFIGLIAGEDIQVCGLQTNAVLEELLKVSPNIIRSQGRTEIILLSTCPDSMTVNAAVRSLTGVVGVIGRRIEIIIAVLIMNAEKIPTGIQCVCQ